jgi:predicted PurR-regulated permease PerM
MATSLAAARSSSGLALLILAAVAAVAALYFGRAVFEPLAFAIFIIALCAPLMQRLQPRIGKGPALIVTVLVVIAVLVTFFMLLLWGVGRIGDWTVGNLSRFQTVYADIEASLAARSIPIEALLPGAFDPRWVLGPLGALVAQLRLISGFLLLIFVFVVLGLTELEGMTRRLARIEAERPTWRISTVARDVSGKFGRYMKVRLVISLVDCAVCYLFFRLIGLQEPLAWAVLVGVLNFIPFIGPLLVSVALGIFAAAQFGSIWMVLLGQILVAGAQIH